METLKKIVGNQYFPAGAVLTVVILFWAVGLLGGLSLMHNNQPPLATLTWMLFVYMAAVLTPIAGLLAALDLVRRYRRNQAAAASVETADIAPETEPATPYTAAGTPGAQPAEEYVPAETAEPQLQQQPAQQKPTQKKPAQKKQGSKKAA
jgi:hypothetical protein